MYWPAHPKPLEDELLSSWLVRIAKANFQKLHTFSRSASPGVEIWNRDLDRNVPEGFLQILAERSGTPLRRVLETTLSDFAGRLFERNNPRGAAPWVLPLGIFHRVHRRFGLQYCPACLAEEPAYYRRVWRIAFVTVCLRHGIPLLDRCHACSSPINFHRGERGERNARDAAAALRECHVCAKDLCVPFPEKSNRETVELLGYQQTWVDALFRGYISLNADTTVYSHLFFSGLRILFQNLAAGKGAESIRTVIDRNRWSPIWAEKIHSIELLDVNDRSMLALYAGRLLQDWPTAFVHVLQNAGIVASDLVGQLKSVPYWYMSVVEEYFESGTYSPALPEIRNAIQYLKRRGVPVTKTTLSRTLGRGDILRKRNLSYLVDE